MARRKAAVRDTQKRFLSDLKSNIDNMGVESIFTKEVLTKSDIFVIIDTLILPFIDICTGFKLYDYQKNIATSICYYVLQKALPIEEREAAVVTVTVARQSGKSLSIGATIFALGMLLPVLAHVMDATGLKQFRKGFAVGLFGPTFDKSEIVRGYITKCATSKNALDVVFNDPSFGVHIDEIKSLTFSNGFTVAVKTANSGAAIEGDTYHLIVIDETQDVQAKIVRQSIMPMCAATGGSIVCIGTPIDKPCFLSEQIFQNRAKDQIREEKLKRKVDKILQERIKLHHEYDWTYHARVNPDYNLVVETHKNDWGEFSDEFLTKYKVQWILDRGTLLTAGQVEQCGIVTEKLGLLKADVVNYKTGEVYEESFKRTHHIVSADHTNKDLVFSIDFGKVNDSTIMTVAKVFWENPIRIGDEERYYTHIYDWIELKGDFEDQYREIMDVHLRRFNFRAGIVDATSYGDPIFSRMKGQLDLQKIHLEGFKFSLQSKHNGYNLLKQEIDAKRLTYPNGEAVRKYKKQAEFKKQMSNLVKTYSQNNSYMKVHAPDMAGWHDDYADSAMMLVWLVNRCTISEVKPIQGSGDILDLTYQKGLSEYLEKTRRERMFGSNNLSSLSMHRSNASIFRSKRRRHI